MAEVGFGMLADVHLHLVPDSLLITDLSTRCADGQQSAQGLYSCQSLLELTDQELALYFRSLSICNVADDHAGSRRAVSKLKNYGRHFDGKERAILSPACEFSVRHTGPGTEGDQDC